MTDLSGALQPVGTTEDERRRIVNRLKRLEGQVRGLQTMVETGKDCDAVLTQMMAAKSAFDQVGLHIIAQSMKTCMSDGSARTHDETIDDALTVFLKYVNCVR